jgi:4-aminobutyrate aminotransferase
MTAGPTLCERDARVIAPIEQLRFSPLAITQARGCHVTDEAGRDLLDLSAGWSAAAVGYAHPDVVEAVTAAVSAMAGASVLSSTNPEVVSLAEELLDVVPGGGDRRVYIGHSGSDANAAALGAARRATGRPRVLAFDGGYHGGFGVGQAVSGLHIDAGIAPDPAVTLVPYPDDATAESVLAQLRDELSARDVAVVAVEAVQCDGGVRVPPRGFLAELRAACDCSGTLLLCDEVKVGLGRTGDWWAFDADAVVPDLVTLGKSLGGGLPLSAAIGPADVLGAGHASSLLTTAGNPVCSAAGRAVLRIVAEEDLPARARAVGAHLASGLERIAVRHPAVHEVRGRGLVLGVELTDPVSGEPAPTRTAKVSLRAFDLGAILYPVGRAGNVLELTPPLALSVGEADRALDILDRALDDVDRGVVSDDRIASFHGW